MPVLPDTPFPGLVEFDAAAMAAAVVEVASASLAEGGPVDAVGIANQRASTIVWDRATGVPVGPGLGWQDLRTVGTCLELQGQGIRVAPNASATKVAALLDQADPDRSRSERGELAFGTVDTWVAWTLSGGRLHVTDASNAGVTGLIHGDGSGWSPEVLAALRIPEPLLPTIVDSSGAVGPAEILAGRPVIAGMAGDQQASLIGQGCTRPGPGQGHLRHRRDARPVHRPRTVPPRRPGARPGPSPSSPGGGGAGSPGASRPSCCRPAPAWSGSGTTWASSTPPPTRPRWPGGASDTGDVWFVPALLGLGTPVWDFGARGTFVGLTRGSGRPELVRAVLEGVAHRGADLLEAAESDSGLPIGSLRVDGGMSANPVFTQALADACGRPIEIAPVLEATTLGAAYLAGMAVGTWADEDDVAAAWTPRRVVDPRHSDEAARRRAGPGGWTPGAGPKPPSPSSPPLTSEPTVPRRPTAPGAASRSRIH